MKVPKYIRKKMHHLANLNLDARIVSRDIDKWFEERGFDIEELRSGNGDSLEELDYGNDVTEKFCAAVESGVYRQKGAQDD